MGWDDYFEAEIRRAWASACPVCVLGLEAERRRYFFLVQEELNSPPVHEAFVRGRGLCNRHSWLLLDTEVKAWGTGLGNAILYEGIINVLASDLERAAANPRRLPAALAWFFRLFPGRKPALEPQPCLVCRSVETTMSDYLHFLVRLLDTDQVFAEAYRGSVGLCFPHLKRAIRVAPPPVRRLLADKAKNDLGELRRQLSEYIRKHDYRYQEEPKGPEQSSPVRVVNFCAGPRGSVVPGTLTRVPPDKTGDREWYGRLG